MDFPSLPFSIVRGVWSLLDKKTFSKLLRLYPEWLRHMQPGVYCLEEIIVEIKGAKNTTVTIPDVFCEWILDKYDNYDFGAMEWPKGDNIKKLLFRDCKSGTLLPGTLPDTIEELDILFNKCPYIVQKGVLPQGLKTLEIQGNVPVLDEDVVLPSGLVRLFLSSPDVFHKLPCGLRSVVLKFYSTEMANFDMSVLPSHLSRLQFLGDFDRLIMPGMLPAHLETLEFWGNLRFPIEPNSLPPTLKHMELSWDYNQLLVPRSLPPNLHSLILSAKFNYSIDGILPSSLQRLELGGEFNQPIKRGTLPFGLKVLRLGSRFNCLLEIGALPNGLEVLIFFDGYSHPIPPALLPSSLTCLQFNNHFQQSIEKGFLPPKLTTLQFPPEYCGTIAKDAIPPTLQRLVLSRKQAKSIRNWLHVGCKVDLW